MELDRIRRCGTVLAAVAAAAWSHPDAGFPELMDVRDAAHASGFRWPVLVSRGVLESVGLGPEDLSNASANPNPRLV